MSEYDHLDPLQLIRLLDKRDARIAELENDNAAHVRNSRELEDEMRVVADDNGRLAERIAELEKGYAMWQKRAYQSRERNVELRKENERLRAFRAAIRLRAIRELADYPKETDE